MMLKLKTGLERVTTHSTETSAEMCTLVLIRMAVALVTGPSKERLRGLMYDTT